MVLLDGHINAFFVLFFRAAFKRFNWKMCYKFNDWENLKKQHLQFIAQLWKQITYIHSNWHNLLFGKAFISILFFNTIKDLFNCSLFVYFYVVKEKNMLRMWTRTAWGARTTERRAMDDRNLRLHWRSWEL